DDHTLFAQGLSRALDNLPDIRVVGIAASGSELLEQIGNQPAEVVITDLEMPGGGGASVLEGVEDTQVIVVTMHASDEQRKARSDDHTLFAQGLSRALDNLPDIRVVGIAASGSELLEQIGNQPAEVVITDLEMPGGGGASVLEGVEDTQVIVVTMHASDEQRKA